MIPDADEAHLRAFLRSGSTSLTFVRHDGVVLEMNDVGLSRLGLPRAAVVGRSIYELLPAMTEVFRERFNRVFDSRKPIAVADEIELPSGKLWFKSHLDPVFDNAGAVIAVSIQSIDATQEHGVAESLRRANEKLSLIFEQSPYLILVYDRRANITYINRVGPGFTSEQVLGTDSHAFVKPEFHAQYDDCLTRVFEERKTTKFEFLDVNGSWWEATLVPVVHDDRVETAISFSVDITDKRRNEAERALLQEQMQNSQKLESLGVLAGGIAHDFNNLLLVVTMNLDLAQRQIPSDNEARTYLSDALTASGNAADLCRQMLSYAGRGQFVMQRLDLSNTVLEMAQLLSVSLKKGARLIRELRADAPPIDADPTQIRQVVLNLITNASDAIGEGQGTIAIRTREERIDEAANGWSQPLAPGDFMVLEVEDTGEGIDPATLRRMFEPFFTTKTSGRGLGLSATLGIVHRHKGAIAVHSTPGVGTRVRVALPIAGKKATPSTEPDSVAIAGRALVLVVDDEPAVRRVAQRALVSAGYEVIVAQNGREALEAFDQHRERIRLVLLDLSMPVMSGQETLVALRERAPTLPVIIMSGYSESPVRGEHLTFLAKPFAAVDLFTVVTSVVNP